MEIFPEDLPTRPAISPPPQYSHMSYNIVLEILMLD